jgi:hypothetical protein
VRRHRLGVAPRLEEVVIGAQGVDVLGGFVARVGERDRQGDPFEAPHEPLGLRIIVDGIHTVEEQRVDLAAVHVVDERGHGGVVPLPLQRGLGEIERAADVAEKVVDGVDDDLHGHLVRAADDERLAPVLPQTIGDVVELRPLDGIPRLGEIRGRARAFRDPPQDGGGKRAELRRRDAYAHVGVAAGDRQARFALDVRKRRVTGTARATVLARELDGRKPCPEEVGFEAHEHARAVERVVRNHGPIERLLVRDSHRAKRNRVVHDVVKRRKPFLIVVDDLPRRGARDRSREKDDLPILLARGGEGGSHVTVDLFPADRSPSPLRPP